MVWVFAWKLWILNLTSLMVRKSFTSNKFYCLRVLTQSEVLSPIYYMQYFQLCVHCTYWTILNVESYCLLNCMQKQYSVALNNIPGICISHLCWERERKKTINNLEFLIFLIIFVLLYLKMFRCWCHSSTQ